MLGSGCALHRPLPWSTGSSPPAVVHRGSSRPPSSRWRPRSSPATAASARCREGRADGGDALGAGPHPEKVFRVRGSERVPARRRALGRRHPLTPGTTRPPRTPRTTRTRNIAVGAVGEVALHRRAQGMSPVLAGRGVRKDPGVAADHQAGVVEATAARRPDAGVHPVGDLRHDGRRKVGGASGERAVVMVSSQRGECPHSVEQTRSARIRLCRGNTLVLSAAA